MERRAIIITGPTCSGKSSVALKLAASLGTEIISADSRQLFRCLNIGTAKPSASELSEIRHHFIDHLDPDVEYNVSRFEHEAIEVIDGLHRAKKIPVIAGGSGLYIKALVDGIFDEVDHDDEFRAQLLEQRKGFGNEFIYQILNKEDPAAAATMLPQNWKRVIRALEVKHLSGKSIIEYHENHRRNVDIDFIQFGLEWERETLYRRIEERVDSMIEAGLVEEVRSILNSGISDEINSLNTVGYKEIIAYLKNEITLKRAVELIKRNTRRYAKRQMTWFRRDARIRWMKVESKSDIGRIAAEILAELSTNKL